MPLAPTAWLRQSWKLTLVKMTEFVHISAAFEGNAANDKQFGRFRSVRYSGAGIDSLTTEPVHPVS
jgi:hypothetical protein